MTRSVARRRRPLSHQARADDRSLPPGPERGRRDERGQSLVSAVAAVGVFLTFLFFAVQLSVNLYATSTVTGLTYDAARRVAAAPVNGQTVKTQQAAEDDLRASLGEYGKRIQTIDWSGSDTEVVRLHIEVTNPGFLFFGDLRPLGFDTIDRTIEVRRE